MVDDGLSYGLTIVLTLVGLGLILYGVTLNYGASLNGWMIAGGGVLGLGVTVLTIWIVAVDEAHAGE